MANWFKRMFYAEPVKPAVNESLVSVERATFGNYGTAAARVNLDTLVGRKGLQIYAQMRIDEQVKAVCTFKRDAILSRGWAFEFDDDSKLSDTEKQKRIRVTQQIVKKLPGSFVDALNVIAVGREYGFSLTEKAYQTVEIDKQTYIGLRGLFGRDPATFNFYTDIHGELIRCEQEAAAQRIPIELSKFVHYVHNPEFDRYFGRSDLREAHRFWYFKDQMVKFWGMYMEKLGGGLVVASVTEKANLVANSPQHVALQNAMSQMKASASIIMPEGIDHAVYFPTSSDAFEKACIYSDLAIAKALLVPNLAGVSNTGQTGAYSQAQSQLEAFAWTLAADAARLEACIDEQVFQDLGEQNWGDGEYPCFKFKPLSGEQLRWMVETFLKLIAGGAAIATEVDETRLRDILGMPPREATDKPLINPATVQQQGHETGVMDKQHQLGEEAKDAQVKRGINEDKTRAKDPVLSKVEEDPKAKKKMAVITPQQARIAIASARERVDFAVIEKRQTAAEKALAADLAGIVARSVNKELGTADEFAKLLDEDTADIGQWQLPATAVGKLKVTTQKALTEAYVQGKKDAQREIRKSSKVANIRFADIRDNAAQYFESSAFKVAGDVSDRARSIIQQELLTSVKIGRSLVQTRTAIWERLIAKGLSSPEAVRSVETDAAVNFALDELWKDTEEAAAAYLDTVARTNMFGAMNEARYAEFTDPALGDFVVALRYSAVLDDRTTEICQTLHDSVWETGNPLWDEYRPPNHFNALASTSIVDTHRGRIQIRDVIAGDMVLTHRSRMRPVYAVMRKPMDKPSLLSIEVGTGRTLVASHEHPVLTTRGWKRADNLKVGDVLFEHLEDMAGMSHVSLIDPTHFPSLFDQEPVAYRVVSSTLGSLMGLAVKFQDHASTEKSEVSDVSADHELEFAGDAVGHEDVQHLSLGSGRFASESGSLTGDDISHVGVPRVALTHALGGLGTALAESPVALASAFRNDLWVAIAYGDLRSLGSHGDAVAFAPSGQGSFPDAQLALDSSNGNAIAEMSAGDEFSDSRSITQINHGNLPSWKSSAIISIADAPYTEDVWNLAVLDDESYVAEGLIVHNCRSLLIPITAVDIEDGLWNGEESPEPSIEPQEGFGT